MRLDRRWPGPDLARVGLRAGTVASVIASALMRPGPSVAANTGTGRAWTAMSSKIRSSDSGDTVVFFLIALAFVVVGLIAARVYSHLQTRRAQAARTPASGDPSQTFRNRAVALGFRAGELRTLRQIAGRLMPKSPGSLLVSSAGRQRLIGDLDKRIRRRRQELSLLDSMLGRLEVAREDQYHARETIRVETDLAIWFVKKLQVDDPAEEGEEEMVNMEPVAGTLLDLSEGGAAISVDIPLDPGEMVEFWSADTQIWIPPLPAGVVSCDEGPAEALRVVHLHFLDPPLADIRRAMQDIQLISRAGVDEGGPAVGDNGEGAAPSMSPPSEP